ncbi:MAG: hypothetical protein M3R17_16580 [Bacteroidota bacterium]|nr:hypothetical protein [Bacteroidota bacterium]
MSNIQTFYPFFENNQVLTSSQLNELSSYLDQQTRLTRVRLIGIGIVCGFNQNYDVVTNKLTITEGTGITSEGFLIESGACEFTKYRTYTLPVSEPPYSPFINTATNLQVPMWELLRQDYIPLPSEVIAPLDPVFVDGPPPGSKKVVLLYLEKVDIDNSSCLGKSCDDMGKERSYTLRKLLISIDDLKIVIANTGSYDLTYTGKFDLPDLLSLRPLFDPAANNSKDYYAFQQNFKNATASVYRRNINDPNDLLNVLRQTYTVFEPVLKNIYGNINPFGNAQIPNLAIWNEIMDGVNSVANGPSYFGIQYFYDFMRDLILAYNEFRDAAFAFMSDCCFNMNLFPMHLILGEAIPIDTDKPSVYRTGFTGIPLTPDQRVAKDTLIAYHKRMVLMMRTFKISLVHNPDMSAPPTTLITPSFEKFGKLSERSIPFYYGIDVIDPQLGTLEKVWNYKNVLRNKDNAGQYPVVAYGNQSSNQNQAIDRIQTPNFYDLDPFNFLRIEGHLRKSWKSVFPLTGVVDDLNAQKAKYDLPFNVVAVRLQGTATSDELLARCDFGDLRSQYVAYSNEERCFMARFFDHFFSTIVKEGNPPSYSYSVKKLPAFISQLGSDTRTPLSKGNSSASFMPAYFALPGQSLPRIIPPIQYSPRTIQSISSDYNSYLNQLMSRMIVLKSLLPTQLDDFDYGADNTDIEESFIGSYIDAVSLANNVKALLNEFADEVTRSTYTQFTPELYFVFGQWLSEQFYFINEFVTDCKFRKLEAVFYELQYRITYLQTNDPGLFSNFIKRNPGIIHNAGVVPGGTFVLVYPGKTLNFSVKTKNFIATNLQEIKKLEVRKAELRSIRAKPQALQFELASIEGKLCDLYAAQVSRPVSFNLGATAAVSIISAQRVSIGENDIIADFSLPYLSNCNCECEDIPPPTELQLGLPAIAMPLYFEYSPGDYAFAQPIITGTYGCANPQQLTIDVRPNIRYSASGIQEPFVKLKFVVNGDSQDGFVNTKERATSFINTKKNGTVLITNGQGLYQHFIYTPPANFTGMDSFEYVFEVYDFNNNIKLRSGKSTVTISVTSRCTTTGKTVATAEFAQTEIISTTR